MQRPLDPPTTAHRYRPIVELGRGGMADVVLSVAQGQAGFNRLVVVKKMRPELAQDPDAAAMFLDEARLAARLNHPNVIQTYEVGQEGEQYFIAMEYLDGQPLNRIRARNAGAAGFPPFPLALQLRVLADVLAGLHHAHELADFDGSPLSVVHRDATPHNVFVTYDGHVKVVDFGIAKAVGASSAETRNGIMKGKIAYMPLEQVRALKLDRRADIFAVGVMLWEAIAGARMWKGLDELTILARVLEDQLPDLLEAAPGAAPELVRIARRALSSDPALRHSTAAEMQADLENFLDTLDVRASAREIGKYLSERFAVQRAAVKQVVETQLSDVRWSGPASITPRSLPRLDTEPASSLRASVAPPPPEAPADTPAPVSKPTGGSLSATSRTPDPPDRQRLNMPTLPSPRSTAAIRVAAPVARPRRAPLGIAIAAGVAAIGLAAALLGRTSTTSSAAGPAFTATVAAAPTERPTTVQDAIDGRSPTAAAPSASAPPAAATSTSAIAASARPHALKPIASAPPVKPTAAPLPGDQASFGGRK